jgi:hypothetical protein
MKITFSGASDDLVEVDGCEGADEFYVYSQRWQGELVAPDGQQMTVFVWLTDLECWAVGVAQAGDEKYQLPGWPVTITQQPSISGRNPGYSALLTIDAPEGTRLVNIKPATDED